MFAYSIQFLIFFAMGLWIAFKWLVSFVCVVGLLSVGMRGINYAPLRHPHRLPPEDVWEDIKDRPAYIPVVMGRHIPLPLAVSPLSLIFVALVTQLVFRIPFWELAWWIYFGKMMLVAVALFGLVTIGVIWSESVNWDRKKQERLEAERLRRATQVDEMICTATGPQAPDVWQLPIGPKTIRFYGLALKRVICKGFPAA